MIVGLIVLSMAVGLVSAAGLWMAGAGVLWAFLLGYVGGGMATMLAVTASVVLCPFVRGLIARAEARMLDPGAARDHGKGAGNR